MRAAEEQEHPVTLVNFMISPVGRASRIAGGAVLVVVGLTAVGGAAGIVIAAIGLVAIAAGALNLCLIGPLFGADIWGRPQGGSHTTTV
jgi:hypothetical protein